MTNALHQARRWRAAGLALMALALACFTALPPARTHCMPGGEARPVQQRAVAPGASHHHTHPSTMVAGASHQTLPSATVPGASHHAHSAKPHVHAAGGPHPHDPAAPDSNDDHDGCCGFLCGASGQVLVAPAPLAVFTRQDRRTVAGLPPVRAIATAAPPLLPLGSRAPPVAV